MAGRGHSNTGQKRQMDTLIHDDTWTIPKKSKTCEGWWETWEACSCRATMSDDTLWTPPQLDYWQLHSDQSQNLHLEGTFYWHHDIQQPQPPQPFRLVSFQNAACKCAAARAASLATNTGGRAAVRPRVAATRSWWRPLMLAVDVGHQLVNLKILKHLLPQTNTKWLKWIEIDRNGKGHHGHVASRSIKQIQ